MAGPSLLAAAARGMPRSVAPTPPGRRASSPLVAVALVWIVVSYFPVSNIPVVLPTVRAERFWYFPAFGDLPPCSALAFSDAPRGRSKRETAGLRPHRCCSSAFLGFQCFAARKHAMDYNDDLAFWDATRNAVPERQSTPQLLRHAGARGNLEERPGVERRRSSLAPQWPMANIYLGDTLCRLHRAEEAWPFYAHGLALSPNESGLVGLAVQCLWDEHALDPGDSARTPGGQRAD